MIWDAITPIMTSLLSQIRKEDADHDAFMYIK